MSPAFRSLLMKDWSERRRLFWCGLGLLLLYTGYCVAYEVEYRTRAFVASYFSTCLMLGWLGSILLAMSTANGEYTQQTLRFSSSLPVSLKQVAWARLIVSWGCLAGPILCGAFLLTPLLASGLIEQAGLRPEDYNYGNTVRLPDRPSIPGLEAVAFLWTTAALAIVTAISSVTLVSLLGTWAKSEEVVGFLGAIVALIATSLTTIRSSLERMGHYFAADWIGAILPETLAINWGYGELDGSSYTDLELAPLLTGPLVVNMLITLALGAWFARRYGCRRDTLRATGTLRTRYRIPRLPNLVSRLGIHWPGQVAALVWLNARQSVSLCLSGLAMAALITYVSMTESHQPATTMERFMGTLPSSTWFVGMLWAVIVAVALFSSELKTGLEQFWRSRPISPATWFWTKFVVGLAALLMILDLIPAMLAQLSPYQPDSGRVGMAFLACFPLIHAMNYSLAIAVICRWRRPVPAAITALMLFALLDQILQSIPVPPPLLSTMNVYNRLEQIERESHTLDLTSAGYPLVYGIVFALIVAATIFARRKIVPPVVISASSRSLLLMTFLLGSTALAADAPTLSEIVDRIQKRDERLQHLHLRVSTQLQRLPAFYETQPSPAKRRRQIAPPNALSTVEKKQYEFFSDGSHRAWTEFDNQGQVVSKVAYDGSVRRDYQPTSHNSSFQGSITSVPEAPNPPFITPDQLLTSSHGVRLQQLLTMSPAPTLTTREFQGEQLIDIVATQTVSGLSLDGSDRQEHRYEITLNQSRNDWPIRLQHDISQSADKQLNSRQIITISGWIDAGPISYPKQITQEYWIRSPKAAVGSQDLVPYTSREFTVDTAEVGPKISDSTFADPFPAGANYYDFRDRKYYEIDAAGVPSIFTPQPKGMRGAVLTYHLLWITGAIVYSVLDARRIRTAA